MRGYILKKLKQYQWKQENPILCITLSNISALGGWFWKVGGWSELNFSRTVIPRVVSSIAYVDSVGRDNSRTINEY